MNGMLYAPKAIWFSDFLTYSGRDPTRLSLQHQNHFTAEGALTSYTLMGPR